MNELEGRIVYLQTDLSFTARVNDANSHTLETAIRYVCLANFFWNPSSGVNIPVWGV